MNVAKQPPSEITVEQFRDLAERMMVDMKIAKDLSVAPFSHVGQNVREWFTEYEYAVYSQAYNDGYDDGNVDGYEQALGGSDEQESGRHAAGSAS